MGPLLTDEDLWQATTQGLRTVIARLQADTVAWLKVLPPAPEAVHDPMLYASERMARLQARLATIPWTVWDTSEARQGPAAELARMDLHGIFLQGRSLGSDRELRRIDPTRAHTLYQLCDDWHNVPLLLADVPGRWDDDAWSRQVLQPVLDTLINVRRVAYERPLLEEAATTLTAGTTDKPVRPRL